MDNVKIWTTGLRLEKAVPAAAEQNNWRRLVYDAPTVGPRTAEEQNKTEQK